MFKKILLSAAILGMTNSAFALSQAPTTVDNHLVPSNKIFVTAEDMNGQPIPGLINMPVGTPDPGLTGVWNTNDTLDYYDKLVFTYQAADGSMQACGNNNSVKAAVIWPSTGRTVAVNRCDATGFDATVSYNY